MGIMKIIVTTTAIVLSLLCVFVTECAASPNPERCNNVHSQSDEGTVPLWSQLSNYVSYDTAAIYSKRDDPTEDAAQPPPWDVIVASADRLRKAVDEGLNYVAREFNLTGKITDFQNTLNNILTVSGEIRGYMVELTQQGLTLDQISDDLGVVFNGTLDYLEKTFPPPDQAPSHDERKRMVTDVFDNAEQGLLDFVRSRGMSEGGVENLRESFDKLEPHVQKLVTITGDLIEQHPTLFGILIYAAVVMLIPESWILRPFLSLMGYGPYGPIKGSPAAWAQRYFWGATVKKGSWFAILQSLGMKGASGLRPIISVIGGLIGATFRKLFG